MTAEAHRKGLVDEVHLIQVDGVQVCSQGSVDLAGIQQGIDAKLAIDKVATAVHIDQGMSIGNSGLSSHAVEGPAAIVQAMHLRICRQTGMRRQEIGALSL